MTFRWRGKTYDLGRRVDYLLPCWWTGHWWVPREWDCGVPVKWRYCFKCDKTEGLPKAHTIVRQMIGGGS